MTQEIYRRLISNDEKAFEELCLFGQAKAESLAREFLSNSPWQSHLKDDLVANAVCECVVLLRRCQQSKPKILNIYGYLHAAMRHSLTELVRIHQIVVVPRSSDEEITQENIDPDTCLSYDSESNVVDDVKAICRNAKELRVVELLALGYTTNEITSEMQIDRRRVAEIRKRIETSYRGRNG